MTAISYRAPELLRWLGLMAVTATLLLVMGCAPRLAAPVGTPVPDPEGTAAAFQRASLPDAPRQVTFAWELSEAGTRLRGRGVARYEAPERLRLDLFGPRGESYLSAALVGDTFLVPGEVPPGLALPSPALLWGAVGVVRPPADLPLLTVTATERELVVRYGSPEAEIFEFRAENAAGQTRLQRVERLGRSGVLESVQLVWADIHTPEQARYRDWPAYRELVLTTEEARSVPSFPTEIWQPAGASR